MLRAIRVIEVWEVQTHSLAERTFVIDEYNHRTQPIGCKVCLSSYFPAPQRRIFSYKSEGTLQHTRRVIPAFMLSHVSPRNVASVKKYTHCYPPHSLLTIHPPPRLPPHPHPCPPLPPLQTSDSDRRPNSYLTPTAASTHACQAP
jgi:hypothetical protein